MSIEENKAIVRRYVGVHDHKNLEVLDDIVSPDYSYHGPGDVRLNGLADLRQFISQYHTAFPDLNFTVEDMIAEGDKVVTRFKISATHTGELTGTAPTGNQVNATGIFIVRIVDRKVVAEWENFDELGMMQQIGAVPPIGESG